MSALCIALTVVGATVIWPVSRWVMHRDGRAEAYGFWIALTGSLCTALLALAMAQDLGSPVLWAIASVTGVAYAFGFCLIIPYCLRIGPVGPTCAANNMGLVWPVSFGFF